MPQDPRTLEDQQVGTRLRDGAVDPRPADFLGPTNAGAEGELGNPHGQTVVNPEIHASQGERPIRPGTVSSDPATQSADESEHLQEWHTGTVAPTPPDEGGA